MYQINKNLIQNIFRKKNLIILGGLLLLSLSLLTLFYIQIKPKKITTTCLNPECSDLVVFERESLSKALDTVSSNEVYELIKRKYLAKTTSEQHQVAHLFGEILYQKKGIDGIITCDSNFAFGCYHGFFINAILDKGLGIVPDLDKACIKRYGRLGLGCQHGIGHGLMEYFGSKKLVQALQVCGELDWQKPLLGCAGGVFMEYNLPLNENGSSENLLKPFNSSTPYGPCKEVPERFQQECFYNLGLWWNQVLNKDYSKMITLCTDIRQPLLKKRCLMGVGNAAATTTSLDISQTKLLCDQSSDKYAQSMCRSGAAWVFSTTPSKKELTHKLCDDLSLEQQEICYDNMDLINNI